MVETKKIAQTLAFIEVLALADQLIESFLLAAPGYKLTSYYI